MTLTEDTKSRIRAEHESWLKSQYGDLTPERRKELGAVYTPADINRCKANPPSIPRLPSPNISAARCGWGSKACFSPRR